jgi:hypothetical protein
MTTGMSNRIIILPHYKTSSPSNILESPALLDFFPFFSGREKQMIILLFKKNVVVASKIGRRLLEGGNATEMPKTIQSTGISLFKTVLSNLRRFALVVQLVK